jgi:hypothetical protein
VTADTLLDRLKGDWSVIFESWPLLAMAVVMSAVWCGWWFTLSIRKQITELPMKLSV